MLYVILMFELLSTGIRNTLLGSMRYEVPFGAEKGNCTFTARYDVGHHIVIQNRCVVRDVALVQSACAATYACPFVYVEVRKNRKI